MHLVLLPLTTILCCHVQRKHRQTAALAALFDQVNQLDNLTVLLCKHYTASKTAWPGQELHKLECLTLNFGLAKCLCLGIEID